MLVVSNTSPISNLVLIDRLDLLRDQFERIWIPDAVRAELEKILSPAAKVVDTRREGWVRPCRATNSPMVAVLGQELGRGEAEAIALAVEMRADLLLLDEREGRMAARQAGLRVRGVLGILLRAKKTGRIVSAKDEVDALRRRSRLFVAPALEAEILRNAGE